MPVKSVDTSVRGRQWRTTSGAVLSLVVVSALVLALIGIGICWLVHVFGGSREAGHAHDAGTLAVGQKSPTVQINGLTNENEIYQSVSETGNYSLKTINRVWGHCLLTMLNSRSMNMNGNGTAMSMANEERAWQAATGISDRLSDRLNTQDSVQPFFDETSRSNSIRMLKDEARLIATRNWATACLNRGSESNIRLHLEQLPPHINAGDLANSAGGTATLNMTDGQSYMKGYYPIPFGAGKFVNFVPYEFKKQPHLVALKSFHSETLQTVPYPEWTKPVPNGFNCLSRLPDRQHHQHFHDAAVLTNTQERLDLEVPNGFLRISLAQDVWHWLPNFMPGVPIFMQNVPKGNTGLGGAWIDLLRPSFPPAFFTASGSYGHQYYDSNGRRTLYQAIYALDDEGHDMYQPVSLLILNRCNQIKPNTSWSTIVGLLKSVEINAAGDSFVIGRDEHGQLMIANERGPDVNRLSHFINRASRADGSSFNRVGQSSFSQNNVHGVIHWIPVWTIFGIIYVPHPIAGGTVWRHTLKVAPGTGVNGAMLEITQHDDVYAMWGRGQSLSFGDIPVSGAGGCGCM